MSTTINLSSENPFLVGSGIATPWYKTLRVLWLIVPLLMLVLGGLLWFWFSKPLSIPNQALIIFRLSPKQFQAVREEWRERLPQAWQDRIATNASTPCLFGLARGEEHLLPFMSCTDDRMHGEGLDWTHGVTTTLFATLKHSWKHPSVDVDTARLADIVQITLPLQSTETLRFAWEGNHFIAENTELGIPDAQKYIQRTGIASPVSNADIFLAFSTSTWASLPPTPVHLFPGLPDLQRLKELPPMVQYELWLTASSTPALRRIHYANTLSEEEAARILMYFGVTERKAIQLPDGTLGYERLLPRAASGTTMFATWKNDRQEWLKLSPTSLLISPTSTFLEPQPEITRCEHLMPWLRLKPTLVYELLQLLEWTNAPGPHELPTVTFGSAKNQLLLCGE